jgi:hypothetical protein
MDTFKDFEYLNSLWARDQAPWKIWDLMRHRAGESSLPDPR